MPQRVHQEVIRQRQRTKAALERALLLTHEIGLCVLSACVVWSTGCSLCKFRKSDAGVTINNGNRRRKTGYADGLYMGFFFDCSGMLSGSALPAATGATTLATIFVLTCVAVCHDFRTLSCAKSCQPVRSSVKGRWRAEKRPRNGGRSCWNRHRPVLPVLFCPPSAS